jgi:two-component system, NarL family, response regulator NreC
LCPHAQIDKDRNIRCVLVHEVVLLRQGLRRLLEDEPDITVVAEAGTAAEALRSIFDHRPEIVIAATDVFDGSAERAEHLILQESPASKILFLTTRDGSEPPPSSESANCAARQTSAEELLEMVRRVTEKRTNARSNGNSGQVQEFPRTRVLTAREREVLKFLAEGKTVRSVATLLGLSVKTVDAHKFNLMRKLGIHNKAELVMWAIQKKVVKVPVNL